MKKFEVIIRPAVFATVKTELEDLGVHTLTISRIESIGQAPSHTEFYRGLSFPVDAKPAVKVEFVVADALVERVSAAIASAVRDCAPPLGKIHVTTLDTTIDLACQTIPAASNAARALRSKVA
jgi:nitrogen regulatory protein PII